MNDPRQQEISQATGPLRAGVAKSDITTDDKDVAIYDRLYAKALVLDDGSTKVVIIAMDTIAIGSRFDIADDFLPKLRTRIENELGIPGCNVLVNASHTHTAGRMLCADADQISRTFDAVSRAAQNMTPVQVGVGAGHEDRIAINRTLRMKDGQSWTIRQSNPCPPDDAVAGLGPIDPQIGILRIDRTDGRPLAVVYNYACHPLIGVPGGGVTANFPGFASKVIEDTLGNGAMALFLQGAAGDVTEVLYKDVNRPRNAEPVGMMLGISTLGALKDIQTHDAELKVICETVEVPRKRDFGECIKALEAEQAQLLASLRFTSLNIKSFVPLYIKYALSPDFPADYSYRYMHAQQIGTDEMVDLDAVNRGNLEKYLSNVEAMEKLARIQDKIATLEHHRALREAAEKDTITAEIQGIRIGDCVLITSPAEVLTQVGLNVKKASPHQYTFMAAFSNGYIDYGPPAADYGRGGYEVTECDLAPQWQAIFEKTAHAILCRL